MTTTVLGLPRLRRRRAESTLTTDQLRLVWHAVSWLLDYPSDELRQHIPRLRGVIARAGLPAPVSAPLERLASTLADGDLPELSERYVATFDHDRRCCLFLTYFAHGDTRKRGVALVRFKQIYRAAGLLLADEELPDYLPVVLEFGASADLDAAWKLLTDHRAGLEMLRISLTEKGSPWADALAALTATLPPLRGDEMEAIRRLIENGPPEEEVGMEEYALHAATMGEPR